MMLDWFYRLIHFRQRRMVVLRLRSSFISTEGGRLRGGFTRNRFKAWGVL
jgi:hypothetical protein